MAYVLARHLIPEAEEDAERYVVEQAAADELGRAVTLSPIIAALYF